MIKNIATSHTCPLSAKKTSMLSNAAINHVNVNASKQGMLTQ